MKIWTKTRHATDLNSFTTEINRQGFAVSWQDAMDRGGMVLGNENNVTIDVEAILEDNS